MLDLFVSQILRVSMLLCTVIGLQLSVSAHAAPYVPSLQSALLEPVDPQAAEALFKGRIDSGDENASLQSALAKSSLSLAPASLAVPATPIPASVAELARALKYDPVLIYEFVHNNIEYLPIWGVLKGSTGTLIDGAGTAFDIAQLTADLINADPAHAATATLVRGTISMPATTAASWIGLNGMNGCPLAQTFAQGGIPINWGSTNFPYCTGTIIFTEVGHVWVKVVIGAATYEIDPSFKTHTAVAPTVNLATATGYTRSAYLAAACTSCNTNPNIVTTLNRAAILNPANANSLPKYARNLLSYLQANNIHDLNQVIGGHKIDQTYHTTLPTLPYTVVSRAADPFVIDGTWKASLLVNINGISQLFSSDAIYGKRLSITFDGSNFPQLNLDGVVVQTGTTAVAPGASVNVSLSICMPFGGVNCSVATVDGSGRATWCSNPFPVSCFPASIKSGGTYVVSNVWGTISHNMVDRHRIATIQATNAGIPATAEANLGEALVTQGLSFTEQANLYLSLSQDGMRNGGYYYYAVGISGHTGATGGPYVDLRGQVIFEGMEPALDSDGKYTPRLRQDNFLDLVGHASVLESTAVNQLTGAPSVSTAKLIDIGISLASQNNIYDFRDCTDYNSYNSLLVSYEAPIKAEIKNLVCAKNARVILPMRGDLSDPSVTSPLKWKGAGYYSFFSLGSAGTSVAAIISGNYAGGYSGAPQIPAATVTNANTEAEQTITVIARRIEAVPRSISNSGGGLWAAIKSVASSAGEIIGSAAKTVGNFISDPVDQISGAFVSSSTDILTGEIGSERSISLDRSYTTADISQSSSLGQGWKSSLDMWAQSTSDGIRPTGMYDAWDAAEILAAKFVTRDLLSDPALPVLNIAVAAIVNRWMGDRLVNNIMTVSTGTSATAFQRLADDSFNPPQQSGSRWVGSTSPRKLITSDGVQFSFAAADTNGFARVTDIVQPSGAQTNFVYTAGKLTQVSNNFGRVLNLSWTGDHITSVSDAPLSGAAVRTVTYSYNGPLLQQVVDPRMGRTLYCYDSNNRMTSYYLPTQGSGTDCDAGGANIVNQYDSLGRVKQQVDGGGHVTDLYLAGTRAEWVTHPGEGVADIRSIHYLDNFGNTIRDISPRTGLATTYRFDALSRLVRTDMPEGNAVEVSYDIRSNPVLSCAIPKTAGAYPACNTSTGSNHIWTRTAFNEGALVWNCANIYSCNKPSSTTDALGNVTTLLYNSKGQLTSAVSPTPSGYAGGPRTNYTYTSIPSLFGGVLLLTRTEATSSGPSPPSIVTTYGYDTAANGLVLKTVTLDPTSINPTGLNYTTTFGYDGYGNQTSVDGPRTDVADVTQTSFDANRNPIVITYTNPGTGSPVTQTTYDLDGKVTSVAARLGSDWMVSCKTYTPSGQVSTAFGPLKRSSPTDCAFENNADVPFVSYGYDGADRLVTTSVAASEGNRITKLGLFADNRIQTVTRAFGTVIAATESTAYSDNGLPVTLTDVRGNISGMSYDGFDRLSLMKYPLPAGGGPSTTDVVAFAYDKRNAVTKRSIRGTSDVSSSCTQCITTIYDELARIKQKTVPTMAANVNVTPNVAAVAGYSVYYHYDRLSRLDSQGFTAAAPELTFAYDNAGRPTSSVQYGRTVSYSYGTPAQGMARTMTWPASAGLMLSCTDALGRLAQIKESADCTTTSGQLVAYGYDDLSRLTSTVRPSGANSVYSYGDTGTLKSLANTLTGSASINYVFDYNRTLQVRGKNSSNNLYSWAAFDPNQSYVTNGLDQYTAINGTARQWDTRGNLLFDGTATYGYDAENQLAAMATAGSTVTTAYDPANRLRQTAAATTTQFLYDGSALIAEYNASSGALLGRYVPGAAVDETAVAYDSGSTKSWNHLDAQGSVVAISNASGAATVINQYGPFGEPGVASAGRNAGRIRYTGQAFVPELGLYNYKARLYAPKLGRFLQTDPIARKGGSNLYAYVGNDPINLVDPTGNLAENRNAQQAAGIVADFTPVVGDIKGFYEAYQDPTAINVISAGLGLVPGVGDLAGKGLKAFAAEGAEAGTTALFRAVMAPELESIQALGRFSNPTGIENKYFSTTVEGAQSYASQAARAFGDGPFSIVQTSIPSGLITPSMLAQVDRGGIPSVIVPTGLLPYLRPPVFPK